MVRPVYKTPDFGKCAALAAGVFGDVNPRLVNLLGSFITGTSAYTLARLEFASTFLTDPAPPVLDRLPDASERTLREQWDRIETQLHAIVDFVRAVDNERSPKRRSSAPFLTLKRSVRELDQYARALRWVLTVAHYDPAADDADPDGDPRRR